jgi:hypothetical protein
MGTKAKLLAAYRRPLCCLNFSLFVLRITSQKIEMQSGHGASDIVRPWDDRPPYGQAGANFGPRPGLGVGASFLRSAEAT